MPGVPTRPLHINLEGVSFPWRPTAGQLRRGAETAPVLVLGTGEGGQGQDEGRRSRCLLTCLPICLNTAKETAPTSPRDNLQGSCADQEISPVHCRGQGQAAPKMCHFGILIIDVFLILVLSNPYTLPGSQTHDLKMQSPTLH